MTKRKEVATPASNGQVHEPEVLDVQLDLEAVRHLKVREFLVLQDGATDPQNFPALLRVLDKIVVGGIMEFEMDELPNVANALKETIAGMQKAKN